MLRQSILLCFAAFCAVITLVGALLVQSQYNLSESERQLRLSRQKVKTYQSTLDSIETKVGGIDKLTAELAEQTSARLGVVLDLPVASIKKQPGTFLDSKSKTLLGQISLAEQRVRRRVNKLSTLPNLFPAEGPISSPFGYRISPFTGLWTPHRGIDVAAPVGTPVMASAPGKVGSSGRSTGPHLHYEVWIGDEAIDPRAFHGDLEFPLPWSYPLDQLGGEE